MTTILAADARPEAGSECEDAGWRAEAPGGRRAWRKAASWTLRLLSFPVMVIAILAVVVFLLIPQTVADPDVWWHLRNAQAQLAGHSFVRQDTYSFTARGAAWINHEWLAELPLYFAWKSLGPLGLFLETAALIEAIFFGVFLLAWRESQSLLISLSVSLVGALLGSVSYGPRTLLFGWLCLLIELWVLRDFAAHRTRIYALPPLFLVWVNAHGSWLIGMALLMVFLLCGLPDIHRGALKNLRFSREQRGAVERSLLLSLGCLFVNPYGWRLVAYPFNLAFRQKLNLENVEEWKTLDFHSPRGRVFLGVLAALFVAQLWRGRSWTLYEVACLGIGVYGALTYSRFLFLAAILVMPLLAGAVAREAEPGSGKRLKTDRPWANACLLLLLAALLMRHLPRRTTLEGAGEEAYPLHAAAYLAQAKIRGNVFNDYLWGGFLIWHARQLPVLIDSRVDIFEYGGVFRDYLDATRLTNTEAILNKYDVRYVVFSRKTPLVYFLEHTPGWKVDYQDETASVLERVSGPESAVPAGARLGINRGRN